MIKIIELEEKNIIKVEVNLKAREGKEEKIKYDVGDVKKILKDKGFKIKKTITPATVMNYNPNFLNGVFIFELEEKINGFKKEVVEEEKKDLKEKIKLKNINLEKKSE